ncbi:hypothetical protein GYMLUDRAFT_410597 [Collybiopsis luxurians FD-317 M1]|nr:hypothetical protein GYMLUDRAFT_410597 [Collybiopsis luxurians FD-317 M1]
MELMARTRSNLILRECSGKRHRTHSFGVRRSKGRTRWSFLSKSRKFGRHWSFRLELTLAVCSVPARYGSSCWLWATIIKSVCCGFWFTIVQVLQLHSRWNSPASKAKSTLSLCYSLSSPGKLALVLDSLHVRILHNSSCVRGRAPRVYYVHVPAASGSKPTEDLAPDTQTKGLRRSLRIQHKSDSQRSKKSGIDGKRSSQQSNRVAELQGKKSSQGSGRNDQRRSDPSKGASKNSQVKVPRTDNERVLSLVISRNRALGYELLKVEQEIVWAPPNQLRLDAGDFAAVKLSWIPGRGLNYVLIEPRLLRDCGGMFGVPKHFYSFRAHHQNGCPTTNHLLLPSPSENPDDFRWNLFRELPENPEYRSLLGHVIAFAGHSLVSAKDLPSLIRAVLHAHLGYYNMCQKNYQHRDLSIGNVLMVDEPVKSEPFNIPNPKNEVQEEILRVCKELKIDDQCTGFVIDGDMAVDWNTYFTEEHVGTKSGTAEFMSTALLYPELEDHMHSPLDDYYSFFFVTQWACAFHALSPEDSPKRPRILQMLRERIGGDVNARTSATFTITSDADMEVDDYGAFLVQAQSFLREWNRTLQKLEPEWRKMAASHGNNIDSFRAIADRGLLSFLKIARKYIS